MIHLDKEADVAPTEQIVMQLAGLIRDGHLPPGTRLPSIRRMAATLTVSGSTVVAAYDRLIARGLIESRAASGFFVAPRTSLPGMGPRPRSDGNDAVSTIRRLLQKHEGQSHVGGGFLPESWLEDTLSTKLLARVARKGKRSFVNPGTAEGYAPLRAQLAVKLATIGIPAHADQVLLTFGVSHAFDLIARALLVPGDAVAVEEPGFFGLFAQLRAHGVRLIPIPRRTDGPDPALLADACAKFRPKLFFTQTLMHNPTGGSTSVAVAAEVLRVAERHDLLIVEDDIYGDLYPGNNAVRLAQINRLQRVIFTASFTKVLTPNMRVGYVAAAPSLIESFLEHKLLSVLSTSEFDERLIYEILAGGSYRKHIERLRVRLAQQMPSVLKGLASAGLTVTHPDYAGAIVWAALPEGIEIEPLVRDAAEQGFLLTPGTPFFVSPQETQWLRFNTAAANDTRLFSYFAKRLPLLRRDHLATAAPASPLSPLAPR